MIEIVVGSPLAGWLSPLEAVPDPVFAERMLGDGVAIDPAEGVVRAPLPGRIAGFHAARHAVTLESDAGPVLLIHVGLDTVALDGRGFEALVGEGDRVAAGDALIRFDLDAVGRRATSLVTPVVLTNGDRFTVAPAASDRMIDAGAPLFTCRARDPGAQDAASPAADGPAIERRLTLPLRHGIHARPAARIAALAQGYAAEIELVAADGRTASMRSPVALLALALPHGAPLLIRTRGHDAADAGEALAALIAGGMGEAAPVGPDVTKSAPVAGPPPSVLRGVTAAPGLAIGPAWPLRAAAFTVVEAGSGIDAERTALAAALAGVRDELAAAADGAGASAAIAAAHLAFVADPELLAGAEAAIASGKSAAFAWRRAIERFVAPLAASADRRFAERVDDLRDLEARVLAALLGAPAAVRPPQGAIVVADELLPSQLMALSGAGIAGFATARGGATSHVAIIAAGMGLPMLAALGDRLAAVPDGTMMLLDADDGALAIDPAVERIDAARVAAGAVAAFRIAAAARAHEPAITADGVRIEVFANLGSLADAHDAVAAGAEGCGLLRTEFLFLDRATPPDAAEQRAVYQAIADALDGRPLIVRTLDIGADKPAAYLPLAAEDNPALGLRGIRIGLAMPALLATQLAALAQVRGDVRIMLPMVIEPAEVAQAGRMLDEAARAAGHDAAPPLGIMVETPAAAMLATPLARDAAFFSIGSNDLSQYALAMDRGNPAVAARLDALHPAVLRLIATTVAGAETASRPTGLCGGMAADPLAIPILIGLGVTELSAPVSAIAATKAHVRRRSMADCRALAERALALDDAAAVRALARGFAAEAHP